ncbi:hypothetical protein HOY82DRAFT_157994 [Tuber indicum]|nr:hypothetical protein HOY82DRAFT_157994 [Tuber indicum]
MIPAVFWGLTAAFARSGGQGVYLYYDLCSASFPVLFSIRVEGSVSSVGRDGWSSPEPGLTRDPCWKVTGISRD